MSNQFARTELLFGTEAMEKLHGSRVAVFGVGGVGGHVVEALARGGVGALDLIDHDTVSLSNINRQIVATFSTIGQLKVEVAKKRVLDINPDCVVTTYDCFYLPETAEQFDFSQYDYVVDAVDTVTAKLQLVAQAKAVGTPIISSMGTGNKLDPTRFKVVDIFETEGDRLARVMRKECRKRGIDSLKVVFSDEEPVTHKLAEYEEPALSGVTEPACQLAVDTSEIDTQSVSEPKPAKTGAREKAVPGSTSFVPSVAGLIIAGEVLKDLAFVQQV